MPNILQASGHQSPACWQGEQAPAPALHRPGGHSTLALPAVASTDSGCMGEQALSRQAHGESEAGRLHALGCFECIAYHSLLHLRDKAMLASVPYVAATQVRLALGLAATAATAAESRWCDAGEAQRCHAACSQTLLSQGL